MKANRKRSRGYVGSRKFELGDFAHGIVLDAFSIKKRLQITQGRGTQRKRMLAKRETQNTSEHT